MTEIEPAFMAAKVLKHPSGDEVFFHQHAVFQLTVALSGTVRIQTSNGWWLATPGTAVLLAPQVEHRAIYPRQAELINVLFSEESAERSRFPPAQMFRVSGLMMELVREAQELTGSEYAGDELALIHKLLVKQLQKNTLDSGMFVPEGHDKRLRFITTKLRNNPGCTDTLLELSMQAHASRRTVARLFAEETGMTFLRWRERLRIMVSIEKMISGQSIMEIALDLGYQSASSFTTAFTRISGMPPRQYMKVLNL